MNLPLDISYKEISSNTEREQALPYITESLVACGEHAKPNLEMYFTVNLAFANYLDELNESIKTPINGNWTSFK